LKSLLLTLVVLILATLLASSAPAVRVLRIEPVQALREE